MLNNSAIRARVAATTTALLVVGGIAAIAAPQATAYTDSNKVHNCFGRYYNTDWDQKCSSPGAGYAGTYETTAACSWQTDKRMTHWRAKYSTATYDGSDCRFKVNTGVTYFWQ
ncbi:hypothetical protein U9R90_15960 [Streptomyces sp. E11-3]|uniref:hypothetical protein n=1 Tax=Streptomyces sp. E11-3 TaxID=3110112 RepID=UPI0039803A3E